MSFVPNTETSHIRADDSTWLRFRVGNARGNAESVEVLLVTVSPIGREKRKGEEPFPTRRLKWADVCSEKINLPLAFTASRTLLGPEGAALGGGGACT
jgi:hypothetical protein